MLRAALFVLLLSCASALQLPSHGRPRLVPLSSSSSSGGGGGLSVRSGPITCKTTDEDWAGRWPNATPEELANMKKWCAPQNQTDALSSPPWANVLCAKEGTPAMGVLWRQAQGK